MIDRLLLEKIVTVFADIRLSSEVVELMVSCEAVGLCCCEKSEPLKKVFQILCGSSRIYMKASFRDFMMIHMSYFCWECFLKDKEWINDDFLVCKLLDQRAAKTSTCHKAGWHSKKNHDVAFWPNTNLLFWAKSEQWLILHIIQENDLGLSMDSINGSPRTGGFSHASLDDLQAPRDL